MTATLMQKALHDWVSGAVSREVVFDHLANIGDRPERPFATITVSSAAAGRHDVTISAKDGPPAIPDPELTQTATVLNRVFVSMNLCEGNVFADMQTLRASVGLGSWQEVLSTGGLCFSTVGESRDLSEIIKGEWEPREQADWTFHAISAATADVYSIEQVQISNATRGSVINVGA
jgi:hypothetical protein